MIKDFFKYYLRTGLSFKKYLKELEKTERFSPAELKEYQNEKLRQTVKVAYEAVPFYKRVFQERKLTPHDIKTAEDLVKLPMIDKHIIRENFKDFRNNSFKGFVFKGLTGGTTGTPGTFFRDLHSINYENAHLWRQWKWGGKTFKTNRVTLRGATICPIQQEKPPFWKVDSFSRQLLMSSYHLNDRNLALYVERIRQYKPFDLYAYPSTAYLLAEYCMRKKQSLMFSAVFTSSEIVFNYQKELIEKAFNCSIYDWYGVAERVAAIGQCNYGSYHIIEDYSMVELIPEKDGQYEIVGTTFNNFVMPIIRYRTGDLVKMSECAYCKCNRFFRKVKIVIGREGDFIKTPDLRSVGIAATTMIPRGVEHLIELQFVQKSLHEIILKIVCTEEFSLRDEKLLIENARSHISNEIKFTTEKVRSIERSKSGKFIPVISDLNR
ncbi:MAG: hypothetical protein NG747_05775 [Candidatus Brocadia sp.]|nr:hypothetical protein [Candidatus Brocadia sp.]